MRPVVNTLTTCFTAVALGLSPIDLPDRPSRSVLLLLNRLHGCYENLKGGSSCEAMEDFTGGITELFDLTEQPPANLFNIMMKSVEHDALMGCSIDLYVSQFPLHLLLQRRHLSG